MFYIKKTNNTLNAQKDTDNLNIIYDKVIGLVWISILFAKHALYWQDVF